MTTAYGWDSGHRWYGVPRREGARTVCGTHGACLRGSCRHAALARARRILAPGFLPGEHLQGKGFAASSFATCRMLWFVRRMLRVFFRMLMLYGVHWTLCVHSHLEGAALQRGGELPPQTSYRIGSLQTPLFVFAAWNVACGMPRVTSPVASQWRTAGGTPVGAAVHLRRQPTGAAREGL